MMSRIFLFLLYFSIVTSFAEPLSNPADSILNPMRSVLDSIVADPHIRMKEIGAVDGLFAEKRKSLQWIGSIIRTSSKGLLVNNFGTLLAYGDKGSELSSREWFAAAIRDTAPVFTIEKKGGSLEPCIVCSKRVFVTREDGSNRLGGVIAIAVDPRRLLATSAFAKGAGLSIDSVEFFPALTGSHLYRSRLLHELTVSIPAMQAPRSDIKEIASVKEESVLVEKLKQSPLRAPVASAFDQKISVIFSAIVALVIVAILAGLVFLRRKKTVKRPPTSMVQITEPKEISETSDTDYFSLETRDIVAPVLDDKDKALVAARREQYNDTLERERGFVEEQVRNNLTQYFSQTLKDEIRSEVHSRLTASIEQEETEALRASIRKDVEYHLRETFGEKEREDLQRTIAEEVRSEFTEELFESEKAKYSAEIREEILRTDSSQLRQDTFENLRAEIAAELAESETEDLRSTLRRELADAVAADVNTERESMYTAARKILEDRISEELSREEGSLRSLALSQLRESIRTEAESSFRPSFIIEETEALRRTIAAAIRNDESETITESERQKLRDELRSMLESTERHSIEQEESDALRAELRAEIEHRESESMEHDLRAELSAALKTRLETDEISYIRAEVMEELRTVVREKILREELHDISASIRTEIETTIREQIEREEAQEIREHERERIATIEADIAKAAMEKAIKDTSISSIYRKVREEIYEETLKTLRSSFLERYRRHFEVVLRRAVAKAEQSAEAKVASRIANEFASLREQLDKTEQSVVSAIPTDSIEKTFESLSEQKKKYRFFNLNSTQTDGLIDYIGRVAESSRTATEIVSDGMKAMRASIFAAAGRFTGLESTAAEDADNEDSNGTGSGLPQV